MAPPRPRRRARHRAPTQRPRVPGGRPAAPPHRWDRAQTPAAASGSTRWTPIPKRACLGARVASTVVLVVFRPHSPPDSDYTTVERSRPIARSHDVEGSPRVNVDHAVIRSAILGNILVPK